MAEIIWTEPALQSLDEIADYISLDDVKAAQNLVKKVFSKVDLLERQPSLGKKIPELDTSIYREIIVLPCRIFYRVEEEKLFIISLQRQEQLFRNHFF